MSELRETTIIFFKFVSHKSKNMYLVNTSFAVGHEAHERWLEIIKRHYIPLLEQRGYRVSAFSRVISVDAAQHFTYSLLVEVPDMPRYKELTEEVFAEYTDLATPLFGDSVMWFTTLMKIINEK